MEEWITQEELNSWGYYEHLHARKSVQSHRKLMAWAMSSSPLVPPLRQPISEPSTQLCKACQLSLTQKKSE